MIVCAQIQAWNSGAECFLAVAARGGEVEGETVIVAGIDVGAKTTKVVLLNHREIIARHLVLTGFDPAGAVGNALATALAGVGLAREAVTRIVATGLGRRAVAFAHTVITDANAVARGIVFLCPTVRTVIDIGAEEARVVRCTAAGRVADFVLNDKCAAGAGIFVETMARALELPLEEMGPVSLTATKAATMNAQCTIFAESEVISLIHARTPRPEIVRAIHEAIANRTAGLVRRVGMAPEVALVGGVAHNVGLLDALGRELGLPIQVPPAPEYVGALGAALSEGEG